MTMLTILGLGLYVCTGSQWQNAMAIFRMMPQIGLYADAITYSSVISALSKGKQWETALEV